VIVAGETVHVSGLQEPNVMLAGTLYFEQASQRWTLDIALA
jgi:hypothetical protein